MYFVKSKINENSTVKTKTALPKKTITQPPVPLSPQFLAIIETAKTFIDNKEEIPDLLLAQLIKAKLLLIKQIEKEKEQKRIVKYLLIHIRSLFIYIYLTFIQNLIFN
jgi:hypothetical protein